MKLNRRNFLQSALLGIGAVVIAPFKTFGQTRLVLTKPKPHISDSDLLGQNGFISAAKLNDAWLGRLKVARTV